LIERELKRDKLVAKYAKKHAELKAIAPMTQSAATKSVLLPVWVCKSSRAMPIRRASATVAKSPVVLVALSVNSVLAAPRSVNWLLLATSPVSPRPAGKQAGEIKHEHE
jgi:hypothetical protein